MIFGMFGYIALWMTCQVPLGILLGRCLRRASDHDLPEARASKHALIVPHSRPRHTYSTKASAHFQQASNGR